MCFSSRNVSNLLLNALGLALLIWIVFTMLILWKKDAPLTIYKFTLSSNVTNYDSLGGICVSHSLCPYSTHTYDNGIKLLLIPKIIPRTYLKRIVPSGNLHETDEESIFTKIMLRAPNHSVFLDIGAALGYYIILAKKINPTINIIAVNPHPTHRYLLEENCRLNKVSTEQIIQFSFAITKNDNETFVMTTAGLGGGSEPSIATPNEEDSNIEENLENITNPNKLQKSHILLRNRNKGHPVVNGITLTTFFDKYILSNQINRIYSMMIDIQGNEKYACRSLAQISLTTHISNILIGTHSEYAHTVCLASMKYAGLSIIELCGAAVSQTMACKQRPESNQPDGLLVGTWNPFWNQYYFNFGFPPGVSFLDAKTPLNNALYPQAAKLVKALQRHNGDWKKINLLSGGSSDTISSSSSGLTQHRQSHHNYTNYIIKKSKLSNHTTTSSSSITNNIKSIPINSLTKKSDHDNSIIRKSNNKNFEILNEFNINKNINDIPTSSSSRSRSKSSTNFPSPNTKNIEAVNNDIINPFDKLYEDVQMRKKESLTKNLVMRSSSSKNRDGLNSNLLKVKIN